MCSLDNPSDIAWILHVLSLHTARLNPRRPLLSRSDRLLPLLLSLLQRSGLSDAAAAAAVSAAALLRAVLARRGAALELTSSRPVVVAALVQLLLDGPRSDYAMAVSAAVLLELTGAADAGWAAAVRPPPPPHKLYYSAFSKENASRLQTLSYTPRGWGLFSAVEQRGWARSAVCACACVCVRV